MSCTQNQFIDPLRRLFCPRRALSHVASLACLAALAGAAGQVRADDEVLKLVPERALGFAIVNNPESADAKIQKLVEQMHIPVPNASLLAQIERPGGITKGFDKKRPVAMLFLKPKVESPMMPVAPVVLVPVDDYDKFLEQFNSNETAAGITKVQLWGDASLVRKLGSYAAITGEPLRDALASLKPSDEVPASVAKWQPWLEKKDAAAVMFAPGIHMASEKLQQGIAMAKMAMAQGPDQTKQVAAALDLYVDFFKSAEKEVDSYGIALLRNNAGAVRFSQRALLVPGGSWSGFVAAAKPAEQNVLAGLPAGAFVVAGGGPVPEAFITKIMETSFGLIKNMRELYGLSEEQADKLFEFKRKKLPPIRGFSFVLGVGAGDEPILGRMVGLMRVDDGKEFLAGYEKYMTEYSKVVEKIDSPMFRPVQCERIEVEGIQSLKVTTAVPQMINMPPGSEKMLEAMYGPGGKITAWIVPCDEHTVIFSYGNKDHLKELIAAVKNGKGGLADDAGVAKAAKLLPKAAVWRFYASPQGIFEFGKRLVFATLPPGMNFNIPVFGATPPVALGLITGKNEVEFQANVPAEVFKEIGRLVGQGAGGAIEQ